MANITCDIMLKFVSEELIINFGIEALETSKLSIIVQS